MSTTQISAEPGKQEIVITREFDAPKELLFRAHVDPELYAQWLGPRRLKMTIDRFEPRDGGIWRYVHTGDDPTEHWFRGVFHGDPSVENGIVQTFEYEGWPRHVALQTLTFEESDHKTRLRSISVFQSVEDRNAMIESGMEEGVNDSMERLDELVNRLAAVGASS